MADVDRDTSINTQGAVTRIRGNVWRGINSLSGASQALVSATPALRKRLIFKNGAATVTININGGVAVVGGTDCMTLAAYEGIAFYGDDCPRTAMTIIGVLGNYFSAWEGY